MRIVDFIGVFIAIGLFVSQLHATSLSCPSTNVIQNGDSVLTFLQEKTDEEPLAERQVYLSGIVSGRALLDLRLPSAQESMGSISLSEHQSYRGLEVISVDTSGIQLRDRKNREHTIKSGSSKWASVLVLAEKRDQYFNAVSEIQNISIAEFMLRAMSLDSHVNKVLVEDYRTIPYSNLSADLLSKILQVPSDWIPELRGHLNLIPQSSEKSNYLLDLARHDAHTDDRRVPMRFVDHCPDNPPRQAMTPTLSDLVTIPYECPLENGPGICCKGNCEKKRELSPRIAGTCGPAINECGDSDEAYMRAFDEEPCIKNSGMPGKCWAGRCEVCMQHEDSCKREFGVFDHDGQCLNDSLPNGAKCDVEKVCVEGKCSNFSELLKPEIIRNDITLLSILSERLTEEGFNLAKINKLREVLGAAASKSDICANITLPNGQSCGNIVNGIQEPKFCFDGKCLLCDSASDNKLVGSTDCPRSRAWPEKKGVRLGCSGPETDICVY